MLPTVLTRPHGGLLKDLFLGSEEREESLKSKVARLPAWCLTRRQICDLELLMNGAFSPLEGFMNQEDYTNVIHHMRLKNGILWPLPVILDISESFRKKIEVGESFVLVDEENIPIALVDVEDIWRPDKNQEVSHIYSTQDQKHPGVQYVLEQTHAWYVGGKVHGVNPVVHYDFKYLRDSPHEMRMKFQKWGWRRIVAFQTRNPLHRAHVELTFRAARTVEANLLIHPAVGETKPGDTDHYTRVRCYEHVMKRFPEQTTTLSLLPLAMRMAGPREALWHALIRKNFGCSHFIVGRDHASPGLDSQGTPFYGPYDAHELLSRFSSDLQIEVVPFEAVVFSKKQARYLTVGEVGSDDDVAEISGTELRKRLREGIDIPDWFSYDEVISELRRTYPPLSKMGFTVLFTGLSGAGKSTIANALLAKLREIGGRRITLLDGDIVRKNLSSELGYSREHRDLNVVRIGFVAKEITKNGGVAICAPIAPYEAARKQVRRLVEEVGGFIEVYVSTPLQVCESRDRKGLYSKARQGLIKGFTGIDDPYEVPTSPHLVIDTSQISPDEASHEILLKLEALGYIRLKG